jgi:hypothetical protein
MDRCCCHPWCSPVTHVCTARLTQHQFLGFYKVALLLAIDFLQVSLTGIWMLAFLNMLLEFSSQPAKSCTVGLFEHYVVSCIADVYIRVV